MTNDVIAPGEAWEEVERLKININYSTKPCEFGQWYATAPGDKWHLGWGNEPLEAVANLLERIAAQKTRQQEMEVANV